MITVLLYGVLAKKFGRHHRFAIRTPAEAVRALSANFPAFRRHLVEHSVPGYRVLVGKEARDEHTLLYPADGVVRIIPVVAGAAKSGIGQTILGVTLIVVGTMTGMPFLVNMGISMTLSGVVQMMTATTPAAPTGPPDRPDNKPSYTFDGAVNTLAQGNPVPVLYGRLVVGSQVISAGLAVDDI